MTTFFIGDRVQFADSVVKRLGHDAECANAKGVVVGWCGPGAMKVDFEGTWIPHEETGSSVRAVPRRNMQKMLHIK
jgi:hypothetical protein